MRVCTISHRRREHRVLWGHGAYLGPNYSAEYADFVFLSAGVVPILIAAVRSLLKRDAAAHP